MTEYTAVQHLRILNKTNYFHPEVSSLHLSVPNPRSYQFQRSKRLGIETRLYYEFKYCQEHNGQVFFYTLTYNDANVPKYLGFNTFYYHDLVFLLNGGFKKQLLRKYGTNIKYFVGAELGEGKGSRGLGNNPHYHIIFFLCPGTDERYKNKYCADFYEKISPIAFRSLVRHYWQGFDESVEGYHSYQNARYGIAKEGQNLGLVSDFRAIQYVSKYVTKDLKLTNYEKKIKVYLREVYKRVFNSDNDSLLCSFFDGCVVPHFLHLVKNPFDKDYGKGYNNAEKRLFISRFDLEDKFQKYIDLYIEHRLNEQIKQYRNWYCNKCRISHGVGETALEYINKDSNTLPMPDKNRGIVPRPIGQYYYRKLYYSVIKDDNGNNMYVLNDAGINYKVSQMQHRLDALQNKITSYVQSLDKSLYDKILASSLNKSVVQSYEEFRLFLESCGEQDIFSKYSIYKLIYETKFFNYQSDIASYISFPSISPLSDYKQFLCPSFWLGRYNPNAVTDFISFPSAGWLGYSCHPYFKDYIAFFRVLDLFLDYDFCSSDFYRLQEDKEKADFRKFHKSLEFKQCFSL